jgi:hypothetical protein
MVRFPRFLFQIGIFLLKINIVKMFYWFLFMFFFFFFFVVFFFFFFFFFFFVFFFFFCFVLFVCLFFVLVSFICLIFLGSFECETCALKRFYVDSDRHAPYNRQSTKAKCKSSFIFCF